MTFFVESTRQPFTHIEVTSHLDNVGSRTNFKNYIFFFTMVVKIKIVKLSPRKNVKFGYKPHKL